MQPGRLPDDREVDEEHALGEGVHHFPVEPRPQECALSRVSPLYEQDADLKLRPPPPSAQI